MTWPMLKSSALRDAASAAGRECGHLIRSHSSPALTTASPSSSTTDCAFHLPDYLLRSVRDPKLQSLLQDCFLVGDEASHLCSSLLISIHCVRRQHHVLCDLLRHSATNGTDTDRLELSSYLKLDNPLNSLKLFRLQHVHDRYSSLFTRLMVSLNKIKRKLKLLRVCTHTSGVVLVVVCSGLSVAVLVVATHGMIGAVAAFCPIATWFRWLNSLRRSRMIRQERQVDAAAKGAYIVTRGLETMGSIVARLHGEIEHWKDIVRIFLRSGDDRRYLRNEVLRGMDGNDDDWVLEELKELEGHVFWCLGTISRTRRLLARELDVHTGDHGGRP